MVGHKIPLLWLKKYIHPVTLALCLHTTSPLPCAHHQKDKQIKDHATMVDLSPSAGGPHVAEATETLIYSSCLPSLNPSLHRDFSLANYWARRLQTTMSGRDFPSKQSSIILSKFVFILSFTAKNSLVYCLLNPPLPLIHLVEYRWTAAATAHSKRQNTSVWCLLMSHPQHQPFYHHKSHKDLHSLQIQQSWGQVIWKKVWYIYTCMLFIFVHSNVGICVNSCIHDFYGGVILIIAQVETKATISLKKRKWRLIK